MTDALVEIVAETLWREYLDGHPPRSPWAETPEFVTAPYRRYARAVLRVIAERASG